MWVKQLYFDGLYHKNCDDWGMIILLIIPRCTGIFFPVTPLRRIKMPSQVKIIKKWMSQGWGSGKQMLEPGKQD